MITKTVLVTASTGTTGRLLVPALRQRGADVRTYERSRPVVPQLRDVDAVFLACPNVPDQVAYECALIDAAAAARVDRIVKLSARGAATGSTVVFWDWHARIERHLAAAGISATVLRSGFSMANLLGQLGAIEATGVLPVPGGDARVAMIDPLDVAAAAAHALLEAPTGVYELTGSAAIGFAEAAAAFTAVLGREVRYVDVPPEQALAGMTAAGLPPFAAEQIGNVFAALRAGAQNETTDDVRRLTGHPAQTLRSYLQRAVGRDRSAALRS